MGRFETLPRLAAPTCGLAQVPPADLDIPNLGQLPLTQLPLGDALEPSAGGSTPRRTARAWAAQEAGLEHAPWDPDGAAILTDLDPRTLCGLPLCISAGLLVGRD